MKQLLIAAMFCLVLASNGTAFGQIDSAMYRVQYKGKKFIGQPMAWDGKELMLLRRNGKLSMLPVKDEKDLVRVSSKFQPYRFNDMRGRLEREFGSKYQITQTENYLVVHPYGNADIWAKPFQDLYYRFTVHFSSRGVRLLRPKFPLVAVVYRSRKEFDRELVKYDAYSPNIIGFYSITSNRIITYDQSSAKGGRDRAWLANNSTIVHEATHQAAFNTGLHSRFSPQVRWISEGLATYFEAKGINHSSYHTRKKDRINRSSLDSLKRLYRQGRVRGAMAKLIVSDEVFRSDPELAYSLAWGMTFFFNEKMPSKYRDFVSRDGRRKKFSDYGSAERARDFAAAFGGNLPGLESRMQSFFDKLN